MCLDDESMQFDVQCALLMIVFIDHNLLNVNAIKYVIHNVIWNTLQLSNFEYFPTILWKTPILDASEPLRT